MQENDIKITIKTLLNLGQTSALIALRDSLKTCYELADDAVNQTNSGKVAVHVSSVENSPIEKDDSKYDANWGYADKFLYVLKRERRFLRFREAAKIIIGIEGFGDEDKLTESLSSSTWSIKKDGTIVKVKFGKSLINTYWGSPKWLDEKGNVKPAYMYDKSALKKSTVKIVL